MSTLTVATVKSNSSSPPAFQNTSGTEVGTLCRAWVNFNGTGTVAIRAQFNVSSITDNGVGTYTVNFTTAMSDANYSMVASASGTFNGSVISTDGADGATVPRTSSSIRFRTIDGNGGVGASDPVYVSASIFR